MRIQIARSVFEVMSSLESALQNERSSRDLGHAWISDNFRTTLEASLTELRGASAAHSQLSQSLAVTIRERREHMATLSRLVRDFYVVLRRRGQRDQQGPALEALYGRPRRLPHSAPVTEWLAWANQILRGEDQAQAQGHPPMVNPSASDIETVLAKASASQKQWSTHQQALKIHEQRLRQASSQGTRTLRGLATRLREALAHESAPTRREIMRTFGFNFISTGSKDRRQTRPEASILPKLGLTPRPALETARNEPTAPQIESTAARVEQTPTQNNPQAPPAQQPDQALAPATPSEPNRPEHPETSGPSRQVPTEASEQDQIGQPVMHTKFPEDSPIQKTKKLSRREKKAMRRAQAKQAA